MDIYPRQGGDSLLNNCRVGDLVKITLRDFMRSNPQILIGTVLETNLSKPHITPESPSEPGPIYEIKILTTSGEIWESWVDQRDEIEVLEEK